MSTATRTLDELIPTRRSLLTRLKNWDDQKGWSEFFDTYWKLIYGVAKKAGLSEPDAQEIVQETVLSVAKGMKDFKTGREHGSFKAWLLTIVRRRIADHFRKRSRDQQILHRASDDSTSTSTLERIPDPNGPEIEAIWNEEWNRNRTDVALKRLQARVSVKQFQIFQMLSTRETSPAQVARILGVSQARVYVTKHRLKKLLSDELKSLEKGML